MPRLLAVAAALLGLTCAEPGTAPAPTPPPPPANPSPLFTIQPDSARIPAGDSLQFQVLSQPGLNPAVRWALAPADFAEVTSAGLVRVPWCLATLASARIRATLLADTTVHAEASVSLPDPFGLRPAIAIAGLLDAPTGQPLPLAALRGQVLVEVQISSLGCRGLQAVQLRVQSSDRDTVLAMVPAPAMFTPQTGLRVSWNTADRFGAAAAFPNGRYVISIDAHYGSTPRASNAVPVGVDNP